MRPCRSTWVASTITKCSAGMRHHAEMHQVPVVGATVVAEYWHIGDTTMRLASSRPARRKGVNKVLDMMVI